eukprot:NODE_119_length_18186_cov_1.929397.p3 type:complete len:407 gc:universal NODE_119_length_18186_cov_1.929397:9748-8528(-)
MILFWLLYAQSSRNLNVIQDSIPSNLQSNPPNYQTIGTLNLQNLDDPIKVASKFKGINAQDIPDILAVQEIVNILPQQAENVMNGISDYLKYKTGSNWHYVVQGNSGSNIVNGILVNTDKVSIPNSNPPSQLVTSKQISATEPYLIPLNPVDPNFRRVVACPVILNGQLTTIMSVHFKKPTYGQRNHYNELNLKRVLQVAGSLQTDVIIAGDFNIQQQQQNHLFHHSETSKLLPLKYLTKAYTPIRWNGGKSHVIDAIIAIGAKGKVIDLSTAVVKQSGTDHPIITTSAFPSRPHQIGESHAQTGTLDIHVPNVGKKRSQDQFSKPQGDMEQALKKTRKQIKQWGKPSDSEFSYYSSDSESTDHSSDLENRLHPSYNPPTNIDYGGNFAPDSPPSKAGYKPRRPVK